MTLICKSITDLDCLKQAGAGLPGKASALGLSALGTSDEKATRLCAQLSWASLSEGVDGTSIVASGAQALKADAAL